MNAFNLTIATTNAAFRDDDDNEDEASNDEATRTELARILREIAGKLENGSDGGKVYDFNGNGVGTWGRA